MNTKKTNPALVFVYLGKPPDYVKYSLILNSRYNKIVFLCDIDFGYSIPNVKVINIKLFYKSNVFINLADEVTKNFRDGFWLKTIERFYVLAAYMKYYNVESLFHGEIDNLIFSLDKISYHLNELGSGLFYPMLNNKIAAASLMYINSIKELELMCVYFNAQKEFKDDMSMLAEYSTYSQNVYQLPSESNLSDDLPMYIENKICIFDVASLGQYLFGIDPRNIGRPIFNKFKNHNCTTDLSTIIFRVDGNMDGFYIQYKGQEFRLINLHIHSKIFKRICFDNKFVLKIVNKLNNGTSTLISINVRNYKFRLFINRLIRSKVVRQLRRLPIVFNVLDSARKLIFRLIRQRKLRRLGYLLGSEQSPVVSSKLKIDIVILSIERDLDMLPHVIDFARANVLHPIGNIYVVSPDSEKIRQVCLEKRCNFVFEDTLLPIRKSDIDYQVGTLNRVGWIYQQLLKLSSDLFCSQENFLVLDSDTLLVRPQVFERDGKYIFNFSDEYHKPYFDVYERLLGYPAACPVSLISHHILVNVHKLRNLKADLEARSGLAWYDAIMNAIDKSEPSGFSEYETYGQYVLRGIKDGVYLEYWHNLSASRQLISNVDELSAKYAKKFKSLSFHSWNMGDPL